jgi:hypothetical protein
MLFNEFIGDLNFKVEVLESNFLLNLDKVLSY